MHRHFAGPTLLNFPLLTQYRATFVDTGNTKLTLREHPTFNPHRVILTKPPYDLHRLGWGCFTIFANVTLKAGYSWVTEDIKDGGERLLTLGWDLNFDKSESRCTHELKVKEGYAI
jgi:hypothetical protein